MEYHDNLRDVQIFFPNTADGKIIRYKGGSKHFLQLHWLKVTVL